MWPLGQPAEKTGIFKKMENLQGKQRSDGAPWAEVQIVSLERGMLLYTHIQMGWSSNVRKAHSELGQGP